MAETPKRPAPPYASFASFITFINKLRDTGVPARIDPSVFGNASGSLSYSIIAALKALKLIESNGTPTAPFVSLVKAGDEQRKPLIREILRTGYPSLWDGNIDLETATGGQFDEHIREEYDAKGTTVDKVATFFIAAASYADLPLSLHLKARKPTASSASSRKSAKQRKQAGQEGDTENGTGNGNGSALPPTLHPFFKGLLDKLPQPESAWPVADQAKWLTAAVSIFGLIYKGNGTIEVKATPEQEDRS